MGSGKKKSGNNQWDIKAWQNITFFLQYNLCKILKQKMQKNAGDTKGGIEINGEWYLHIL